VQTKVEISTRAALDSRDPLEEGDKTTRDQAMAAWAHLLVPIIRESRALPSPQAPPRSTAQGSTLHMPPSGAGHTSNQTSVSTAPGRSQTSDTPVNEPGPTRLVLSVTCETLGQIELVIDRDKGGVSIWIGATQDAQAIISTDKFALLQNLARSGVNVRSLGVMSREAVGTVLAEGKLTPRESAGARNDTRSPDGKIRRRLSLIG
jgi:hypothetical protein